MREILKSGAATAASNLGHDGTGPSFAMNDRELLKPLGDVPFHDLLDRGKVLINTFYSKGPTFTYMDECGGGGSRDALAEVQKFPKDLDMAAAIGFTNYGTHHGVAHMWVYNATHKTPASYIPGSKYQLIHDAALAACDMKDGFKDGVIEDPPRCGFDPGTLTCKGGDSPNCLTPAQVTAVRTIYATPVHARTKATIYGSMPPGSEMGWDEMAGPVPYPYSVTFYKYLVFKDEKWDYKTRPVNFDEDLDKADAPENFVINQLEADISPFIDNGGKLLMVGGWNDHTLGPGNNVDYYDSIVKKLGPEKIKDSVRLFMVPGMDHCFGDAIRAGQAVADDIRDAFRHGRRPQGVEDLREGAGHDHRDDEGQGRRTQASRLRLPAADPVQGFWQHRRSGELRLRDAEVDARSQARGWRPARIATLDDSRRTSRLITGRPNDSSMVAAT